MGDFDETAHPRDEKGEFTSGGASTPKAEGIKAWAAKGDSPEAKSYYTAVKRAHKLAKEYADGFKLDRDESSAMLSKLYAARDKAEGKERWVGVGGRKASDELRTAIKTAVDNHDASRKAYLEAESARYGREARGPAGPTHGGFGRDVAERQWADEMKIERARQGR